YGSSSLFLHPTNTKTRPHSSAALLQTQNSPLSSTRRILFFGVGVSTTLRAIRSAKLLKSPSFLYPSSSALPPQTPAAASLAACRLSRGYRATLRPSRTYLSYAIRTRRTFHTSRRSAGGSASRRRRGALLRTACRRTNGVLQR